MLLKAELNSIALIRLSPILINEQFFPDIYTFKKSEELNFGEHRWPGAKLFL